MDDKFLPYNVIENLVGEHNYFMNLLEFNNNCFAKVIYSDGEIFFKNGNRYKGPMYNGLMEGKGELEFNDGTIYRGEFLDNNMNGKGKINWNNGSNYDGIFENNKRHGKGKLYIKENNFVYDGQFNEGKPNGHGIAYYSNRSEYHGNFLDGIRNGKGIYKYKSGNYYEGNFKNNLKNGYGIMNWVNEKQYYEGEWINNNICSYGRYIWKGLGNITNNRYEGEYINGQRHGFGIFYYSNGSAYIGKWKNDKKEGESIFIDENGISNKINFKNDKSENFFKNINDNASDIKENIYKNKFIFDLCFKNKKLKKLLQNKLLYNNSLLVEIYKKYNTFIHEKFGKIFIVKNIFNIFKDLRLLNYYLTLPNLMRYFYKFKRSKNIFIESLNYIESRLNFMNQNEINKNKKYEYLFNEYNNPINSSNNDKRIIYFNNFVQILMVSFYLKSYVGVNKRNKDELLNKSHIWDSVNLLDYIDKIINHIIAILNKSKSAKLTIHDEEIILNKSVNLLPKFKKKFKNLYFKFLNIQQKEKFINKLDYKYVKEYHTIDKDIIFYKNLPIFDKKLNINDFRYLKLETIYKIFKNIGFLDNDYIIEDSESTRLNQSNIIQDKNQLFFKIFERKNDPIETYYDILNMKKKNKKIHNEAIHLKKVLSIEIFLEDFINDLLIYIIKLSQVSGKDKRFETKAERKLTIFLNIMDNYFDSTPAPKLKPKKSKRIFPMSKKDYELKNIIEFKQKKYNDKIFLKKKIQEKQNITKELKQMKKNDYNTLLIKDEEEEEYFSENYDNDGDSYYVYKDN